MQITELVLDNSKRKDFHDCPQKCFLSHEKGYKPSQGSTALRFGSVFHSMMEGYYKTIFEKGWSSKEEAIAIATEYGQKKWDELTVKQAFIDDYRTFDNCLTLFTQYLMYFNGDESYMKILGTETRFSLPMTLDTPEEKRLFGHLPQIIFTGRIDLSVFLSEQYWINDFKTTGYSPSQEGSKQTRSPQMLGYSYAGKRLFSFQPSGALVTICQAKATKSKVGDYYGKLTVDFLRVPNIYTDDDIQEWKLSFLNTASKIYECTLTGFWPKENDSCYNYGRCPYTPLCEQNRPFEELNLEGFSYAPWNVLEED